MYGGAPPGHDGQPNENDEVNEEEEEDDDEQDNIDDDNSDDDPTSVSGTCTTCVFYS